MDGVSGGQGRTLTRRLSTEGPRRVPFPGLGEAQPRFCREGLPHLTEGRGPGARHWPAGAHGSYDHGRLGACISKIPGGLLSDPLRAWVGGVGGQRRMGGRAQGFSTQKTNSCSESAHSLQESSGPLGGG